MNIDKKANDRYRKAIQTFLNADEYEPDILIQAIMDSLEEEVNHIAKANNISDTFEYKKLIESISEKYGVIVKMYYADDQDKEVVNEIH